MVTGDGEVKMEDEKIHELEIQIAKLETNQKADHKRLNELGDDVNNLSNIAISIREIAIEIREIRKDNNELKTEVINVKDRVRFIENIPSKHWNGVVDKVISVVIGCVVAYILSRVGF